MISVAAHETALNREDAKNKRLIVVILVLVGVLVASIAGFIFAILKINKGWIDLWNSYDFVSESYDYEQDGRGINIIGDENEVEQYGAETSDNP